MTFSRRSSAHGSRVKRVVRSGAVAALAICGLGVTAPQSAADDDGRPPGLKHVTYTVTTEQPFFAEIFYRDVDPPDWGAYSHNPYEFSPRAEAEISPGQPWVREVWLADPDRWAMVAATSGRSPQRPMFHCELAVDGVVVATNDGPNGALCSLRNW